MAVKYVSDLERNALVETFIIDRGCANVQIGAKIGGCWQTHFGVVEC